MSRDLLARGFLGLGLITAWGSLSQILRVDGTPHPRGLSALVDLSALATPVGFWSLTALFIAATAAFVLRWHQAWALGLAVGLLALGGHIQMSQWPGSLGVNGALVLPGAAGTACLLAAGWRRLQGADRQAMALSGLDAACGIAAAGYTLAAINKLDGSGLAWASGSNLALHITVHGYAGIEALLPMRLAVADNLLACAMLGVGTLLIEGSFGLFIAPRLRRPMALLAVAMHLGISLFVGLHHFDWMFLVLGLGLYPRGQLTD
jgi:hypothetical protein